MLRRKFTMLILTKHDWNSKLIGASGLPRDTRWASGGVAELLPGGGDKLGQRRSVIEQGHDRAADFIGARSIRRVEAIGSRELDSCPIEIRGVGTRDARFKAVSLAAGKLQQAALFQRRIGHGFREIGKRLELR